MLVHQVIHTKCIQYNIDESVTNIDNPIHDSYTSKCTVNVIHYDTLHNSSPFWYYVLSAYVKTSSVKMWHLWQMFSSTTKVFFLPLSPKTLATPPRPSERCLAFYLCCQIDNIQASCILNSFPVLCFILYFI